MDGKALASSSVRLTAAHHPALQRDLRRLLSELCGPAQQPRACTQ